MTNTCDTCRHWLAPTGPVIGNRIGICRRFPPAMMVLPHAGGRGDLQLQTVWPHVGPKDICGEHVRKMDA